MDDLESRRQIVVTERKRITHTAGTPIVLNGIDLINTYERIGRNAWTRTRKIDPGIQSRDSDD